MVESGVIEC